MPVSEHRRRRDGDAIEPHAVLLPELVRAPDGKTHRDDGQRGGLHRHAQTRDDVRGMPGLRRAGHFAHRAVFRRRVVLGDDDHRRGEAEADERATEHGVALRRHELVRDEPERHRRDDAGHDHALVQRVHDLAARARLHEEGAEDRRDDGRGAKRERVDDGRERGAFTRACEEQAAEQHGRDDRDRIGLEEIRRHARAVAHVVADVVRDDRGVARIVFGDARFHLADEVRADVRTLRENAAAESREDGDEGAAERKSHERMKRVVLRSFSRQRVQEHRVVTGHAQQAEPHDEHARDRAALEGDAQRGIEPVGRGLSGAHVRAHRDVHADVAREAREDRADREPAGGGPVERETEHDEENDSDEGDRRVLPVEIGLGSGLHGRGDFLHACIASWQPQDRHH
jgi:hypothetical protein